MEENILSKARKLLALIRHPSTPSAERESARHLLESLCRKHNLTTEQINSIHRVRQQISYIDIKHDSMLIHQLILVVTESPDHLVQINKMGKILITELTEAEHAAVIDMLIHYRKEYNAIRQSISDQIKSVKAQAKAQTDRLSRVREKTMLGIIHANKIFPPSPEKESTELTTKKTTKKKTNDLADIVAACQIAQGTAYKKPSTNLTNTQP